MPEKKKTPNWKGIVMARLITVRDALQKENHIASPHISESIKLIHERLENPEYIPEE